VKVFAAIVPDDAEPSDVADEIVKVVDMLCVPKTLTGLMV
jgi:hypothetical protein